MLDAAGARARTTREVTESLTPTVLPAGATSHTQARGGRITDRGASTVR
jgi:hypothetical protein